MLNDKVNDIYNFFFSIGCFAGPLMGSLMEEKLKPRLTCDYTALMNLGFALMLFVFNCGFGVYQEQKEFEAKLSDLALKVSVKYDYEKLIDTEKQEEDHK